MALAPRSLAITVFTCRSVAIILQVASLTYVLMAEELGFSVFIFLKLVLAAELILNSARLLYDGTQAFLHQPLPAERWMMSALVAVDLVMLHAFFAAGASSLGVVDYLDKTMRQCALLPSHACDRFWASGILTVLASAFTVPVIIIMFRLHVIWEWDHAAAAAAHA
ncbi:hypothetical protein CFC21_056764 [Triticum aestivum]|uniref:CASP-like protein n=2 Tax=Triticum aestivum TaxID=4565 RepID=A0A9R1GKC2_WHEAT|nr:uncharacterized protein LOC123094508 [Triticum aestivum]KAF7047911.1 hypothetical protein CFC21_056764 [Triticum aestivum]